MPLSILFALFLKIYWSEADSIATILGNGARSAAEVLVTGSSRFTIHFTSSTFSWDSLYVPKFFATGFSVG